jgi:sugar lactone lactonase YvrE
MPFSLWLADMKNLALCLVMIIAQPALIAAESFIVFAGGGNTVDGGPATSVKLIQPFSIVVNADGSAWTAEQDGHRIRRMASDGSITTVVGTGVKGTAGVGGPGTAAEVNGPHHLLVLPDGRLIIADTYNKRVLQFDDKTGVVAAFAGTGETGFSGDGGPAISAKTSDAYSIALSKDKETVYLADIQNRRIRAIAIKTGIITTVAGNGAKGAPKDGELAASAPLMDPRSVAVDADGRLYILERNGHCLRVVEKDGKIFTVVGTGAKGNSGDNGNAKLATLNGPKDLFIDHDGTVLIADCENHVIRRYDPKSGNITRVAGTGTKGNGKPGKPLETALDRPHGVHIGPDGSLYICDSNNGRILKLAR